MFALWAAARLIADTKPCRREAETEDLSGPASENRESVGVRQGVCHVYGMR